MTQDDDDNWTPEKIIEDYYQRVTQNVLSTIWLWTRIHDDSIDEAMSEALVRRICDAITPEAVEEFRRQRDAEEAAQVEERLRKDVAVVRKPDDIGATWHRPLTERSVVCGKPIPENAATGNIGDPDVHRTFLCRACLNAGDNLSYLRRRRQEKEARKERGY